MKSFIVTVALILSFASRHRAFGADYPVAKPRALRAPAATNDTNFTAGIFGGGGTCAIRTRPANGATAKNAGFAGNVACAPLCLAMGCSSCTMRGGNC